MGLLGKLFNKSKKENKGKEFPKVQLNRDNVEELERQYRDNPHFLGICRYEDCFRPLYKSDKYKTIKHQGKDMKFHVSCLRKMKKDARRLVNSGVIPRIN